MKNKLFALFLIAAILVPALAFAKPEQLEIKSKVEKGRENQAREKLKTIHISRIQDPETRKALEQILNYLNLPTAQN